MPSESLKRSQKLIYRIDNESQKVCTKTISEILESSRNSRSRYQEVKLAYEYQVLHRQFHDVILFTRELIENPLIQGPEFKKQFIILSEIIKATDRIRVELNRFDSKEELICDPVELKSFLNVIQNQLVQIDEEFRYLKQLEEYLIRIAEVWESIDKESEQSRNLLEQVTQRIIHDTIPQKTLHLSSNQHFLHAGDWIENESDQLRWELLNQTIHSARLSCWLSNKLRWSRFTTECLVMASILKDLGKLRQAKILLKKDGHLERLQEEEFEYSHPSLGAALVSNLGVHPVKLPELITQHHERVDGSGYPRRLVSQDLSRESTLFIIINRLTEYYSHLENNLSSQKQSVYQIWCNAISRIVKESEEGLFEKDMVQKVTQLLGFGWDETEHISQAEIDRMIEANKKHLIQPAHYLNRDKKKHQARSKR